MLFVHLHQAALDGPVTTIGPVFPHTTGLDVKVDRDHAVAAAASTRSQAPIRA
ncbi:hypothetical protein [Nocardioides terrae]|uniref:hypothetical protein n=1 Tax=Nocardioides terrae TaxID=574651 RepID=UPI001587D692|nr:hypothetical protein [Nocardioides terrae]